MGSAVTLGSKGGRDEDAGLFGLGSGENDQENGDLGIFEKFYSEEGRNWAVAGRRHWN